MKEFKPVNTIEVTKKVTHIAVEEIKARGIDFNNLPLGQKQILDVNALMFMGEGLSAIVTDFLKKFEP